MAGIEFEVDAVLGDTSQLQQQINNLRTNLNLNINNTQALQSIRAVQQQINTLQRSMNNMRFNFGGNGGNGGNGGRGGVQNGGINASTAQFETETLQKTESLYRQISNTVNGTVKNIQVLRNEQGQIVSGVVTVSNGFQTWRRNLEFIDGQFQRVIASGRDTISLEQRSNGLYKEREQHLRNISQLKIQLLTATGDERQVLEQQLQDEQRLSKLVANRISRRNVDGVAMYQTAEGEERITQLRTELQQQELLARVRVQDRQTSVEQNENYRQQLQLVKDIESLQNKHQTASPAQQAIIQTEINRKQALLDNLQTQNQLTQAQQNEIDKVRQKAQLQRDLVELKRQEFNTSYGNVQEHLTDVVDSDALVQQTQWFKELNAEYSNTATIVKSTQTSINKYGESISQCTVRVKNAENQYETYNATVNNTTGELRVLKDTTKDVMNSQMNLTTMLTSAIERFAVWGIAMKVWTSLGNAIQDCTNYVVDLDSAMTNIRVVTMDTKEATQELLETYNQLGQELGADTLDVAEGAVDWLRQGFNEADTTELVKDSTILSKLALIDNAQATEYLTSALKGYKLEAQDAIGVIDQLVAIDLEASTSAGDMAEAMSRTANMARTTGFEMNELLGVIATVSEVTQNSASTVGNSIKTLLSRMSNVKAGVKDFEGESLNDVEKTLNRVGIALRDNQGNWYDFYDVLDEVASKWDSFSDIQQSQITTALGGTRQRENVLVALENWDKVKQYAETGATSAGTAMEKYDIILESVSAKQEQLNAKVQEFYMNLFDSGALTGLLNIGQGFMDIINLGDGLVGKLLLLTATTIGLSFAMNALRKTAIYTKLGLEGMAIGAKIATVASAGLKAVLDLLKAHPIILTLSIITSLVMIAKTAFEHFNVTLEEQHEKAQTLQSDYQSLASELETVNSELKTTQQRIDELNNKDTLSVVEQEELERLKQTNAELEKRQYWLQIDANNKKAEVTTEAQKAWDKDFNKSAEYASRYKTRDVTYSEYGIETTVQQTAYITETEYIDEQIKYYGELEDQINKLVAKEGQWTEEEKTRYDSLITEQKEVQSYLRETGAKIQTDYLDSYDVDDATKNSWIELRDKIGNVLDIAYNTTDAVNSVGDASNNLEAPTFDDVFSDYAGKIQSLSEQYEILTKAQEEYNEYGNITASTMKKIIDNNLLGYLEAENGQLKFNTQALQDKTTATQNDAIASLQSALFTDLQSIALGTYQEALDSTDETNANTALQNFQTELGNTTGKALETATAISALNSSLGTDYQFDTEKQKEQADKVVANYNAMVAKVKSISTNLSAGTYRSKSSGGSSSKSKKEWWETALEELKQSFEANDITLDAYIQGLENILGKVKKGSEGWKKITKELQEAKLDNIENQFKRGEITIDQYIQKLTELRKTYKKNTEGYKELTETINDAKYDKFANQYERGEITASQYIKQLQSLQKQYKKGSEEYKKIADEIDEIKLEKTEKYLDKLEDKIDAIDQKINRLGDVNTDKESVKYAQLLSQKYIQVQKNIASIKKQLKDTNLTDEQREALQEKLNDLLVEEVDIRDEIEDRVRTYYENQREQAELEAEKTKKQRLYNKEVELYGKQGKELYEYYTRKEIDALNDKADAMEREKEAQDKINEREELQNNLIEARLKLQNALNNKTTKILKKQADGTWQYEYSANMADVKEAQQGVKDAEKALEDFDWEQGIQDIRDSANNLQESMDNLAQQYEDEEFWAEREYEQTMNGIETAYGDIDGLVEKWMKTYGGDDETLTTGYQSLVTANNTLEDSIAKLTTVIESKYETVGVDKVSTVDGVKTFDTGGKIVGSGLILAHDKERVLTEQQNLYFEQLVSKLPQLLKAVDITKFGGIGSKSFGSRVNADKVNSTVINKVECVFPNINSTDGLQKAILQLPRLALQNK